MEESKYFTVTDLQSKFRSKLDLYNILKHQCKYKRFTINGKIGQFMLPSYRKYPVSYMKGLLSGKKKARDLYHFQLYRL